MKGEAWRSPEELFHEEGTPISGILMPSTVGGFWRWGFSDLMENITRGMVVEYLVGLALNLELAPRKSWDAHDLILPDGRTVEVKSSAALQAWKQARPSTLRFAVEPRLVWDYPEGKWQKTPTWNADIYILAMLPGTDPDVVDPMDVSQWEFFVLSCERLKDLMQGQKSIAASVLRRRGAEVVEFDEIPDAVEAPGNRKSVQQRGGDMSVTEIQKRTPNAHDRVQEWRRENPSGFLLNYRGPGHTVLHRVDCPRHLGDTDWDAGSPNWGSLGNSTKLLSLSRKELITWADEREVTVKPCQSCNP